MTTTTTAPVVTTKPVVAKSAIAEAILGSGKLSHTKTEDGQRRRNTSVSKRSKISSTEIISL